MFLSYASGVCVCVCVQTIDIISECKLCYGHSENCKAQHFCFSLFVFLLSLLYLYIFMWSGHYQSVQIAIESISNVNMDHTHCTHTT